MKQAFKITEEHNRIIKGTYSTFIKNRFDISSDDFYSYEVCEGCNTYLFMGIIEGSDCVLGLNFTQIKKETLSTIFRFIFNNHPNVQKIHIDSSYQKVGYSIQYVYYRVPLPATSDELRARLSKKGKYNIKRELRQINENIGIVKILEFSIDQVPEVIFKRYFELKKKTYDAASEMSSDDYVKKYSISDCYAMYAGNELISVIFSCEQLEEVYLENLTYDVKYAQYSPGQVLYDWYLTRLIEKGKTMLYLGGGDYMYKKRYGSIAETVYYTRVFRNYTSMILFGFKRLLAKLLKIK